MSPKKYNRFIILTVQNYGKPSKSYRLNNIEFNIDLQQDDLSKVNDVEVFLQKGKKITLTEGTIMTYRKHGSILHSEINKWITSNKYNETERGKPTKLIFELKVTEIKHIYKLYQNQGK